MRPHQLTSIILCLIVLFLLASCNLPASISPATSTPGADTTAISETIVAQLTQVAGSEVPAIPSAVVPTATLRPPESTPTQVIPTATLPPTATMTPPPSLTPTLSSGDPRASLGKPTFYDGFADSSHWPLYTDDHVSFVIKNNELNMTAFNPDFWEGWMITTPVIDDNYLEMTATFRNCAGQDRYGMLSRATKVGEDYEGYFFGITCDGRYSLRIWADGKFTTLVDWTQTDFINSGENAGNRIGLLAKGDRLAMYANGNLLQEVQNDSYSAGKFGVFIGSAASTNFKVRVDEIAEWDLP